MEGESGVTRSMIDELDSSDMRGYQMEDKVVLFEVSLMNIIHQISSEIKWKAKVVLLEVSLMNYILRIGDPKRSNGR